MADIPGMTPEIADAARDVLALVTAAMRQDEDAIVALLKPHSRNELAARLVSMAGLTANLMRSNYGEDAEEYMAYFTREYLV